MKEIILGAIKDFDKLLSLLEKKEESKVGESFRARCRELPSLIEDVGFIPALSFCYAKATENVYENVKSLIENGHTIKDDDHVRQGYGIYFYFILKKLKDLGLVKSDLKNPIEALKELMSGKERIANKFIKPYLIQLKKLSEAVFKG